MEDILKIGLPCKLNYLTGIIHHPELVYMTVGDVIELLEGQVYRARKAPGTNRCKVSWLITERRELPATLLLGWDRVKVSH